MNAAAQPFGTGSVALRLYAHSGEARFVVRTLLTQARLAEEAGFDGVTISEHHGGFPAYLPQPLQIATWILAETQRLWSAPAPLLLPLRPPLLVAEEAAWLAARYPGRVGIGVASGSLEQDFAIAGVPFDHRLGPRFGEGLTALTEALHGRALGPLAQDPAVAALAGEPIPVVVAAMSRAAVRRAAGCGIGILSDGLSRRERVAQLFGWYREAGGSAPAVLTRWIWIGSRHADRLDDEFNRYSSYTPADRQRRWAGHFDQITGSPARVAEQLLSALDQVGATALNVRVHSIGTPPDEVREQIERFGSDVLPALRTGWSAPARAAAITPRP
jgi:alkanesulfonate monooxygenase SsuD/methylene tetrahydromethanopterin reductase-like flavin-dependent oxidoreductase (luciferase family)